MKKGMHFLAIVLTMIMLVSCSKNEVGGDSNCYVCSNATQSIDVCEEGGDFVIDGELVENPNGASLEELIAAVEANVENDPDLVGVSCRRK